MISVQHIIVFCVVWNICANLVHIDLFYILSWSQIANETVSITSLKVVFDLLHFHGLDVFDIEEPAGNQLNVFVVSAIQF